MALPDKNQNPHSDSGPSHLQRPLWSRIVATTKSSLIYTDTTTSTSDDGIITLKSLVFRVGQAPDSLMFDVTSRPESQQDFFKIIATQLPTKWGVAFHMEGSRKIIEINFLNKNDTDSTLASGLLFPQDKLRILPTPALNDEAKIVRLNLTNLPFFAEDEILYGLKRSLKPYGHVLDVGISRERAYHTYIGQGYVVLDTFQPEDAEEKYLPLTHNLTWEDSSTRGFRATWHNMPRYCTYCHDGTGTHTANDCPEKAPRHKRSKPSPIQPTCWNCASTDHVKKNCPVLKPRKTPTLNQPPTPTTTGSPPVSENTPARVRVDAPFMDTSEDNDVPMKENNNDEESSMQLDSIPDHHNNITKRISDFNSTTDDSATTAASAPSFLAAEDQLMDNAPPPIQFINQDSESIGRQYNVENERKTLKVILSAPSRGGSRTTRSSSQ